MAGMQYIRGLAFRDVNLFSRKNVEDTMDYVPRDGDIVIASYPKTGTTWLQYIVFQIISKPDTLPSVQEVMFKKAPFMEITGTAVIDALESPRIYKHHCPYNMVQKNPKAKMLYMHRKPEDTLVSCFHFMRAMSRNAMPLDEYFESFLAGTVPLGCYYEHVLSFYDRKNDDNLLLVSYEKLIEDRRREILRIAKFLGDEYFRSLSDDEKLLEKIVERSGFEYMRQHLPVRRASLMGGLARASPMGDTKVDFFRKGVVGEGAKTLSSEQLDRLRRKGMGVVKHAELIEEWF